MADYVLGSIYILSAERGFKCVGVGTASATFVSLSDDATVFSVDKTVPSPPLPLYEMQLDSAPPAGFTSGATLRSKSSQQRYILIAPLEDVSTQTLKVCSLNPIEDPSRVVFVDTAKLRKL